MTLHNKFWGRNRIPLHTVTHRAIGDIPGMTPAQDVFAVVTLEEMRVETDKRATAYCKIVDAWRTGSLDGQAFGHREFMNHRLHTSDVTLNVIKNPSKPYTPTIL